MSDEKLPSNDEGEKGDRELIVEGIAVGGKIGQGKPNVMLNVSEMKNFQPGEILPSIATSSAPNRLRLRQR